VGGDDGSRLISLAEASLITSEYLALSHCWGKGITLRTTTTTLDSFRISIAWESLPKTFQHAIQVTRELGFGFLWIDSLCIIQDDPEDWNVESAKMAGIYNIATLTIMAASASDSQGGCFQSPSPDVEAVHIPYTAGDGTTELSISLSQPPLGYRKAVSLGPLFQRAWVFQEQLLSKRKLIFAKDQL
jgi:hypothetical protein